MRIFVIVNFFLIFLQEMNAVAERIEIIRDSQEAIQDLARFHSKDTLTDFVKSKRECHIHNLEHHNYYTKFYEFLKSKDTPDDIIADVKEAVEDYSRFIEDSKRELIVVEEALRIRIERDRLKAEWDTKNKRSRE